MPATGNKLNCMRGSVRDQVDEAQRPVSPPKEQKTPKNQQKLVRVGSKLYGKNTHVERKFNIGLRVEKAPGGVAFRTQNEIVVDKQREYKLLEGRLPTYPGELPREVLEVVPEEEGS